MAVMATDGGGGGYAPQPSREPQTHVVTATDTVDNLADRYGVTPQALRDANPQVFQDPSARRRDDAQNGGDLLQTGETINIPPVSQSIVEDPLNTDHLNPNYPSPNSEYTVGSQGENVGGAVTWNPGDGSVKVTGSAQTGASHDTASQPFGIPNPNGPGTVFEAKVRQETAVTDGVVNKDGNTEITVEADVNVSVSASAEAKGRGVTPAEAEVSAGAGFRARYKVILPGENQNPERAERINPFDPTTIPDGATVVMDGQYYEKTSMAGSFRHIGVETSVTDARGTSYAVTRNGNSVQVMMGPTQAVEAFNGVGLRSDIATAMLGRQDNLGASTVRTAQFDLSKPDGQAAYAHFVATGQVAHETAGVSNVATIERIDYSSQTRLKLGLGPEALNVQADLAGPRNTGAVVKTTYPDGSYTYTTNLQYSGNVPMQVTQRFDASGNEVLSERTYEFKVSTDHQVDLSWWDNMWGHSDAEAEASLENSHTQLLNWAFTGGGEGGPARAGKTNTITFTEAQMAQLHRQTTTAAAANDSGLDDLRLLTGGEDGAPVNNTLDFAVAMARNLGGDNYGFAERLHRIASGADGDPTNDSIERIDATVTSS